MTTPKHDGQSQARPVQITATDHSVAAHSIGNLNVILEAPAPKAAATAILPVESLVREHAPFIGRQAEIDRIAAVLDSQSDGIVIVTGPPGVGKTALTRQAVESARGRGRFTDALFADLRGYEQDPADRVQPEALYAPLLRRIGVPDTDIPPNPEEQVGLYHRVMDTLAGAGKPILLWLDNVSDGNQFDPLRPANPAHKMAVTSRETFGHIANRHVVDLQVLDVPEAIAVLAAAAEDRNPGDQRFHADTDAAAALANLCDRLPLALQIVAALLGDEPHRPIADLVTDLTSEENRLNSLHYHTDLSVRAALTLSYNRLPEDLQRLLRLLSVIPSGDVGLQAAAWLINASTKAVRPQLMALVRSHLIGQHVNNRWSSHDLIRLYATEQSAHHPDDAEQAFKRIIGNYTLYAAAAAEWLAGPVSDVSKKIFTSPEAASEWFQAERPTAISIVMNAAGRAEYRHSAVLFGVMLGTVLQQQRDWLNDLYNVSAVTAKLATQVPSKRLAAGALNLYGSALHEQGELDRALEVFKQADQIEEEDPDAGPAGTRRNNVATVLVDQGRIEEAIEMYRQDIRICRESVPPERFQEARTLANIGAALATAERFDEAVDPLREAIAIMRTLQDLPGVASASTTLGAVLQQTAAARQDPKVFEEAVTVLEEALDIFGRRGNQSKFAKVAANLGPVQFALGRYDDGVETLGIAYAIYQTSGQPDKAANILRFLTSISRRS